LTINNNNNNANHDTMPPTPKPTSHKKKKKSTLNELPNHSLHLVAALQHQSSNSPSAVSPVATQTQGDATGVPSDQLPPPSSPLIVGPKTAIDQLPSPHIANKRALANLVSGYKPSLWYNLLLVHKASKKKMKVAKLNDNVIFTFLRNPIVNAIAGGANVKPLCPSDHLKKANNHFENVGYDFTKSELPNVKGRSKRIAASQSTTKPVVATVVPPSSRRQDDLCQSIFPSCQWVMAIPALTHCCLRRYLVEDCLQCGVDKSLLIMILLKHPSFAIFWQPPFSSIYDVCPTSAMHLQDGGVFSDSCRKEQAKWTKR
jgi:hypothetical protein